MTLYMKLGGRQAIAQAVPKLKHRLEEDPCFDVAGFQSEFGASGDFTEFLVFLSGGAPFYEGKPISDLLSPLCTCADVYDRFVDHLVAVLFDGAAAADHEGDVRDLMARLQPRVLDPKPVSPVLVYSVDSDVMRAS